MLTYSAGDDATAALTMLLRYHRKQVTFDEVRQSIYEDRTGAPSAAHVVEAAERFRLRGRGLVLEDPLLLESIPTPNIALVMRDRGQFPRPSPEGGLDGYFAVVVSTSQHSVRWIDPYTGQIDDEPDAFLALASGIFLIFDEADTLPRARLWPGRKRR